MVSVGLYIDYMISNPYPIHKLCSTLLASGLSGQHISPQQLAVRS